MHSGAVRWKKGVNMLLAIGSGRFTRMLMWDILFFLLTLLPMLQPVPNTNYLVADRYTYLPY